MLAVKCKMPFITPDIMLDFSNFQNIGLGKILHFLFNLMKMKNWDLKNETLSFLSFSTVRYSECGIIWHMNQTSFINKKKAPHVKMTWKQCFRFKFWFAFEIEPQKYTTCICCFKIRLAVSEQFQDNYCTCCSYSSTLQTCAPKLVREYTF